MRKKRIQRRDPESGSISIDDLEGLIITVSYPKETYYPIKFNGFDVGDLSLTATVPHGHSVDEVHRVLWEKLQDLVEEEFSDKLSGFIDRVLRSDRAVRRTSKGS